MTIAAASAVTLSPAPDMANTGSGSADAAKGSFNDELNSVLSNTADKTQASSNLVSMHNVHQPWNNEGSNGSNVTQQVSSQRQRMRDLENDSNPALNNVNIPALRAALAQHQTQPTMPANNGTPVVPGTTIMPVAPGNGMQSPAASGAVGAAGTDVTTNATPGAAKAAVTAAKSKASKTALTKHTQEKLLAALKKAANAKVPQGTQSAAADAEEDTTAPVVPGTTGKSADIKAAATDPKTVTKIETAAMANASETAIKTPTPQAKIEAQALQIDFGSAAKADGKDSKDAGTKDNGQQGSANTAGSNAKPADASAIKAANTQPQQPDQPATPATPTAPNAPTHAAATADAAASTNISNVAAQPQTVATTLQVSQGVPAAPSAAQTDLAALGVTIAAKSKDGEKQFDINMHPAELGRVDVRISVDADGKAQAHLMAEKPQTLQLLQNDKAALERQLKESGLDLSNNGLNFSLKGEQQPSTPTFIARARALSIASVQSLDTSSSLISTSTAPGDSRLDIRV